MRKTITEGSAHGAPYANNVGDHAIGSPAEGQAKQARSTQDEGWEDTGGKHGGYPEFQIVGVEHRDPVNRKIK